MTAVALVIRERRESDIENVIRLAERVHDLDGYPPSLPAGDYRAFLFAHETLGSWVAEIDGQIVGQVALHPHTGPAAMDLAARVLRVPAERLGVVARLLVSPGYRRQGVAGELLFAAARRGCTGTVPDARCRRPVPARRRPLRTIRVGASRRGHPRPAQ